MTVKERCNRNALILQRDQPIDDALKLVRRRGRQTIVVVDPDEDGAVPVGLIHGGELAMALLEADADQRCVGDLLHRPPVLIHESLSMEDAVERMVEDRVRSLLVVDDQGLFVGLLDLNDALGEVARLTRRLQRVVGRTPHR